LHAFATVSTLTLSPVALLPITIGSAAAVAITALIF
jgi:hypothetical protein